MGDKISIYVVIMNIFFSDVCKPNPCKNKGTCQRDTGKPVCICEDRYTGDKCQTGIKFSNISFKKYVNLNYLDLLYK